MTDRVEHTAGPWRLQHHYDAKGRADPNRFTGIYEPIPGQEFGSRSAILSVGLKGAEVDDYWINIKQANARLIAAAPDLLAALKALQLQALQSTVNDPANEWGQEALELTRAAISKATGEA